MTDYANLVENLAGVEPNSFDEIGIYTHANGDLNLTKSLFYICRHLTQIGHATPKAFLGKPYQDAWWGPENFKVLDVENYFLKFDLEVEHNAIVKGLSDLARKHRITPVFEDGQRVRNAFQADPSML